MHKMNSLLMKVASKAYRLYLRARLIEVPGIGELTYFCVRVAARFLPQTVDVNGSKMRTDSGGAVFNVQVALNIYEPFMTEVFKRVVKEGDTVIDIGANVGYYTLLAARIVGQTGKVYAFEPHPKSYGLLLKNIELNRYTNIVPVQKAVSNEIGVTRLFVSPYHHYGSLYKTKALKTSIQAETETLDHFFRNSGDVINVIKMDIEGGEMDALVGMDNLMRRNRNLKMFIECSPAWLQHSGRTPKQFLDRLLSYNSSISVLDEGEKV